MDGNLFDWLTESWPTHLDRDALRVPDGPTWSYARLDARSAQIAHVLSANATVGERVLVQVDKSPDAVALYLACLRAGLVYVPLNTAYTAAEVDQFAEDAAPAIFVGRTGRHVPSVAHACTLDDDGSGTLANAADSADDSFTSVSRVGTDWVAMLYTSGTTGRSKGAMLSGSNLATNAEALRAVWQWRGDDVLAHILPIFHVHGLFVALHCALRDACPMHFVLRFDPDVVARVLPTATVLMGVPTHYQRLLDAGAFDGTIESMRLFTSGSAPMTEATHAAFTSATGHTIVERYGMTEAMIITSNPFAGEQVPGTVGHAVPGTEVRVADADGMPVEAGEIGTVETRGPNTFLGYWGLPDKTADTLRSDGWLITGDIGSMDSGGRVTLSGRESDMIISGGLNVYPKEIEQVLDAIPGVIESAVIGVAHPDFGEVPFAVLVADLELSDSAVESAVADRLARFKHPKGVVTVPSLPRNAMGKVQKGVLRATYGDAFVAGS